MSTSYTLPQALVFQEFEAAPEAISTAQRACIIGPRRALIRYAEATEKDSGLLGAYDRLTATPYPWPNRATGDVVIPDSVRLFIDDALLQYFNNPAAGDNVRATTNSVSLQDLVSGDASGANVVRASNLIFRGKTRSAGIPCDVAVGDGVRISAPGVDDVLVTQVTGFLAEKVESEILEAEAGASNVATDGSTAAGTVTVDDVTAVGDIVLTGETSTTDHVLEMGVAADTYDLIVREGGDFDTAVFDLVSASGTDNKIGFNLGGEAGVAIEIGVKGILLTFNSETSAGGDLFETGMRWALDVVFPTVATAVESNEGPGAYTGAADTTYIVRVSRGGAFADSPQVTVSTSTGVDYSGPHTVVDGVALAIGARGVTVTFTGDGLALGDRFYVPVTAEKAGVERTLVLRDALPAALTALAGEGQPPIALSLTLYVRRDIEVPKNRAGEAPLTNFDVEATRIVVNDGIAAYDARVAVDDVLVALPVAGGTLYVEYMANVASGVGEFGSVTDVGALSLTKLVGNSLGTVDAANPLAYGVYKALANVRGGYVTYLQTAGDTLADYLSALAILSQRDDAYILTPMTFDRTVQDAVAAHVENMSGPEIGRWRICFLCRPAVEEAAICGADATVLATIADDPAATGTQYTRVTVATAGIHLIDLGVRPTDVLRCQYESDGFNAVSYVEYVIDAIVSPTQLRIASGPDFAIEEPLKIEIWRPYTRTETAAATGANAGSFGSRRVYCVWPDYAEVAGQSVPGYYLAAALAGLKSSVLPQQGLTSVEVAGFDGMSRTTRLFDMTQLNYMANAGMMIVTQSPLGQIYVRHSLSTDNSDINTSELMRTTNLDSISYVMLARLANFQGKYNVTPKLMELIRLTLLEAVGGLRLATASETVGPQILGLLSDLSVTQHPLFRDRILVVMRPDLPYPNNNTELHIVV